MINNNEPLNNEELNKTSNEVKPIDNEIKYPIKKDKGPIYFAFALLFMIGSILVSYLYLTSTKDVIKNTEIEKKEEIIYKPYSTTTFSFVCYYKSDLENGGIIRKISLLKENERIICSVNYEVMNTNPLNDLTFEVSYGDGLRLITATSDRGKLVANAKTSNIIFDKPQSVGESVVNYEFEVIDNSIHDNLFVSLDSVKFKAFDGTYFKTTNSSSTYLINRSKYYIYANTEGESFVSTTQLSNSSDYTYKRIYNCSSVDCKSTYYNSGNYVLFIDDGLVAYDIINDKKEVINYPYNSEYSYQLVADKTIRGLIKSKKNYAEYYSIEYGKIVLSGDKYSNIFFNEKGYLTASKNENDIYVSYLLNIEGEIFVPSINDLKQLKDSNYYYYHLNQEMDDDYVFYTKEGKPLFDGRMFYMSHFLDGSNLIIISEDGNKFLVYDSNYQIIKISKEYKKVYSILKGIYFIIVDSDNYLKIIDYDEVEKAKFTEMTDNLTFHPMISGWHTEDGKSGIYLILGDSNIEYPKNGSGLEYFYIPENGETGVIKIDGGGRYAKPVLYLYPKEKTKINVSFEKPQLLTTTYPKFINSWEVTAKANGDLYDNNNKYYYGLYWEEEGSTDVDFKTGFYVTKNNSIKFLEDKLSIIGLNDRERNEFIMYWLPILESNGKSLVYFELTEERDAFNKLIINPRPDSLLRVAIHVKKVDNITYIKEQSLPTFNRVGFTAIEWGGVIH